MADQNRLLVVSLTDANRELVLLLEAPWAPGRPRWRVRFRDYPAYRNIDESYRAGLWSWLDESGQRCGSTFTVEESPRFASWNTEYLHDVAPKTRHFVITTEDDVVEVLASEEPVWEVEEAAEPQASFPGKAEHLYMGEDDVAIKQLIAKQKDPNSRGGAG